MSNEVDPTEQIDSAIADRRWSEARTLLQDALASMPPDWKPIREEEQAIEATFWDMDEFLAYTSRHPAATKSVFWMPPSYSRWWWQLSEVYIEEGLFQNAVVCIESGLAIEPDHPLLWISKGFALNRLGRFEDALEAYRTAEVIRSWAPASVIARALRGQGSSLIDLNHLGDAQAAFERSLELDPNSEVARKELEYIREAIRDRDQRAKTLPWFLHCVRYPPTDPITVQLVALVSGMEPIPGPQTIGSANYSKVLAAFEERGWAGFEEAFDEVVPRTRLDYGHVKRDLLREPVFNPKVHERMSRVFLGQSTVDEIMQEAIRDSKQDETH
jgi:tetratricopeptide (TPR) repeat protein